MKKVKNIFFKKNNIGSYDPYFELEDGTFIEAAQTATGNCWMIYWKETPAPIQPENL